MSISLAIVALALSAPGTGTSDRHAPAGHAWHPGHEHHAVAVSTVQMITTRGRALCAAAPAGEAATDCTFEAANGKKYPLIRVVTSRALFEDANLRSRDLEITGQIDASGRLEVIQTRTVKDGKLYDAYYWCETCSIRSPYGGDCWCCFQPFDFKEVLLRPLDLGFGD